MLSSGLLCNHIKHEPCCFLCHFLCRLFQGRQGRSHIVSDLHSIKSHQGDVFRNAEACIHQCFLCPDRHNIRDRIQRRARDLFPDKFFCDCIPIFQGVILDFRSHCQDQLLPDRYLMLLKRSLIALKPQGTDGSPFCLFTDNGNIPMTCLDQIIYQPVAFFFIIHGYGTILYLFFIQRNCSCCTQHKGNLQLGKLFFIMYKTASQENNAFQPFFFHKLKRHVHLIFTGFYMSQHHGVFFLFDLLFNVAYHFMEKGVVNSLDQNGNSLCRLSF